jgi:hypothetical protein
MSVTRHWLVVNRRGDLVAWVESEAHAKAVCGAYPDAKLRIDGPFVPEAEQPQGAVSLTEVCAFLRSATYPDPATGCDRHPHGYKAAAADLERHFGGR